MKAKVKFDSAQAKVFLLHHVEKLVFGGFVVAFLLLCWSAFKLKPYPKTPDQLKATADRVSQEVEKATPPDKFPDLPGVPNFSNLGAVGAAAVDPRLYKIDPLSRPYEDRQELRKEPKFFALEQPLAFAGYGGIAIDERGGVQRVASSGIGGGMGMGPEMAMGGMGGAGYGAPGMVGGTMDPSEMMRGMAGPPKMVGGAGPMGDPNAMAEAMKGMMPGMVGGRGQKRPRGKKPVVKKPEVAAASRRKPQVTEKIVLAQPPSGAKVVGRYWVCLTGAIPYRKEFLEYQSTFRDARGYEAKRDYPRYALPRIERAQVNGEKLGEWQSLDLEEAIEDLRKWAVEYPEIADKEFLDPDATEPLPPLIFANHDKDKVNHPLTQVAEEKPKAASETGSKKRKVTTLSDARRAGPEGYGRANRMGRPTGIASAGLASRLPEYRLFRFFDFAVEPGKTYRYRVKLALVNPNYDAQRRYLENYAFGEGATREADWSQPSGPITVIAGNRLLAGGVSVSPRGEPAGSVLAKLFDADQAVEVRKIFDVHRGSVLNHQELEIGLPDPKGGHDRLSATVNFETDAVVLDMFGGEKLAGSKGATSQASPKVPGHLLVLDNDGGFKTLIQASDSAMYETEADEVKNQAPPKEGERKAAGAPGADTNGAFKDFDSIDSPPKRRRRP